MKFSRFNFFFSNRKVECKFLLLFVGTELEKLFGKLVKFEKFDKLFVSKLQLLIDRVFDELSESTDSVFNKSSFISECSKKIYYFYKNLPFPFSRFFSTSIN